MRLWLAVALVAWGCSKDPVGSTPDAASDMPDLAPDVGADVALADVAFDVPTDAADQGPADGPITANPAVGPVTGEVEDGIATFLGVPYAQPPLGDLRWEPPQPISWTEPLDATSFGPRCPQPNIAYTSLVGEEDCLHLNVWRPANGERDLPVMVWFHGGSFIQGATVEKTYRGEDLAAHGVVVVTANYRLGALGYLSHRELGTRNVGLQDQLAALDWVQENIDAFGGDGANVTVFGESAGGISACLMVAAGHGDDRFVRAISQSGPCTGLLPLPDVADAEAQADALAVAVGCDQSSDVPGCLRGVPADQITEALGFRIGVIFGDGAAWTPVRDGELVPLDVETALAAAATPMVLGSNADEGSIVLVGADQGIVDVDYLAATTQMFPADVDAVRAEYPLGDFAADADAVAAIVSDRFTCGTRRVARLRADAGHATWLYHFTHPFITPIGDLGAMHGAELPFVFGTELALVKLREDQLPLSESIQRMWTNFAKLGDPNIDEAPWPSYMTTTDEHIVLDTDFGSGSGLRAATCDFWDGVDG